MSRESLRRWVVPLYLFLCIVLGGSGQGIWANMALQLLAVGIIAWAFLAERSGDPTTALRQLMVLAAVAVVVVAVQLVPLPPSIWTALPGRQSIAAGFDALGYSLPSLPVSLTPYATVAAALTALPAMAVLIATIRIRQRESWLAGALLVAVFAAVLLGALQVASGGPTRSPWYFYRWSNYGAVGFFANINHMGSLLLVSIPFAMSLFAGVSARNRERSPRSGIAILGIAALIVTAFGTMLNRSLAALALAVPVLLFSTLLLPVGKLRRLAFLAGTLAVIGCVLFLTTSSMSSEISGEGGRSLELRVEIWTATLDLIRQSFPAGTGLGSFEWVYPLSEESAQVHSVYVNHAHNDYLQIVLELGLAGALWVAGFLAWWLVQVVRIWRSPFSTLYARAATIASGALLVHSVVDYPLRTAALSAIFAISLGLMAQPRGQQRSSDDFEARPTRHASIG